MRFTEKRLVLVVGTPQLTVQLSYLGNFSPQLPFSAVELTIMVVFRRRLVDDASGTHEGLGTAFAQPCLCSNVPLQSSMDCGRLVEDRDPLKCNFLIRRPREASCIAPLSQRA